MNVNTVKVFWETRKATAYKIQIADTESTPQESDWQTVKEFKDRPKSLTEKIVLDQIYKARYVRLYVDSHTSEDPDGGIAWNTISIYELEVYGGNPDEKMSMSDVLNGIQVETPKTGDKKLKVTLPEVEGYTVEYNGTDFEQVIDEDLTIYQPISDKNVKVSFKITDNDTNDYKFKEIAVTVPGSQKNDETANKAPNVLPELAEWNGGHGNYTVSKGARIVYKDSSLQKTAEALANDYEDITGKSIAVVKGESKTGDITLALTKDKSLGLQDEGYLMDIDDSINIKAETTTGAYWATRTILQSIKQSGNVPCGTTRDYPLYKVRSFILDVGRKTFIMDYLKVLVEEIHSVVVATVDETGHPHTAVMDMMWEDGKTVYFLTADFKPLYKRLKEDGRVAVTGMTQGAGTMDRKSISLTGQVEWIGKEHLEELLKANPYMYEIYPTEEGRSHLQVFRFKNSVGNFYDLTQLPPYQARFEIEG